MESTRSSSPLVEGRQDSEQDDEGPRRRFDSVVGDSASFFLRTDRRLWWLVVGAVGLMISCWSVGVPYFSGPDEPLHASRAWSVVNGQVVGAEMNLGGFRLIEAPAWLDADRNSTDCYRFNPEQPADCFSLESSTSIVKTRTQGAQSPLFYAISGLPFRFADRGLSLFLTRIWSGLFAAALIASAVVTARRSDSRRWLLPAILLSCTPMVFYIAGVTNPSGVEITAALLLWTTSISIFCDRRLYGRLMWRFALSASLLILTRQLGPLWVVVIVVSCAFLSNITRIKQLLRDRGFRLALVGVALSGGFWAIWSYALKPLAINESGFGVDDPIPNVVRLQVGRLWSVLQESVGVFGWLEVKLPFAVYLIWIVGVVIFIGLAVTFGKGKFGFAPLLVLAVAIILQTFGEFRTVRELGFMWQGRYTLPLLVGVPLVSALAVSRVKPAIRVSSLSKWIGGLLLWGGLCLSFFQTERRYMVGASGPMRIWQYGVWHPPVPILLLLAGFAVSAGVWILICAAATKYVGPLRSNDGTPS